MQQRPPIPDTDAFSRGKFLNTLAESYIIQDAILGATELAVISTTKEGIINSYNAAAEKMLGYKAEELLGKHSPVFFHDLNEVLQRAEDLSRELGRPVAPGFEVFTLKAQSAKTADRREWTFIRKDGTRLPVMLSISTIWNDKGDITGFLGIATDITEQKIAEVALRESEQKFRLLAENIPGVIYLCRNDAEYSMVYLSDSVEAMTGYAVDDFLNGKINFVKLYHPDDAKEIFRKVDSALAAQQSFQLRYRIKTKSGDWRWVDEYGTGVYQNNQLTLLEGYLIDITEQMLNQQKLEESQSGIQAILASLDDIVMEIDEAGNYLKIWANRPDTLFFSLESHQDNNIRALLPQPLAEIYQTSIQAALRDQKAVSIEYPSIFPDDHRWFSARFTPIRPSPNTKPSVSVFIQDITARKKAELDLLMSKSNLEMASTELQEQNHQLNEFAHIISHNLRSPVANISALISLLSSQSTLEEYRSIFERLKSTAGNLQYTLNDLMETLHIKKGAFVETTELSFLEVLTKTKQDLAGEIIQSKAVITYDFSACPSISYAKTYLESIFLNLLSNALKYRSNKRQPMIHFESGWYQQRPQLKVQDNGLGIDLNKYGDKVFGLRKTFHEHKEARGVGLFLTRTQVEAMGGKITVESAVDAGSTFTIRF